MDLHRIWDCGLNGGMRGRRRDFIQRLWEMKKVNLLRLGWGLDIGFVVISIFSEKEDLECVRESKTSGVGRHSRCKMWPSWRWYYYWYCVGDYLSETMIVEYPLLWVVLRCGRATLWVLMLAITRIGQGSCGMRSHSLKHAILSFFFSQATTLLSQPLLHSIGSMF